MSSVPETVVRGHAQALGCLRPGWLKVEFFIGSDWSIPTDVPMDIVPFDLRMPNSRFTVLFNKQTQQFVSIER
jgi:hypothetical protein